MPAPATSTSTTTLTGLIPAGRIREVLNHPLALPYPTMADRAAWTAVDPRDAAEVLATAESDAATPWPILRAQDFARFVGDGDRQTYEAPYFERRRRLTAAVLAACLNGDDRWVVEAVDGIWLLLEETTWTVPAHAWSAHPRTGGLPTTEDLDLDLFCAETGGTLAWVDHLLGDAIDRVSPEIRPRVRTALRERVIEPFLRRRDWRWLQSPVNNWSPWIHSNVLAASLLVDVEPHVRQRVVELTLAGLDQFIADTPADGGCDEGVGYWVRAGGSVADCLWLLHDVSGGRLDGFAHPVLVGTGRYLPITHVGGPWVVNVSDGPAQVRDRSAAYPLLRLGRHTGQDDVVAHALALNDTFAQTSRLVDRLAAIGRLVGLLLDTPRTGEPRFPYVAGGFYPVTELFSTRQHPGSADGLYLCAKGGHNAESHNHNDVGSFVIGLDGRPLVVDIGVGTYTRQTFNHERYSIFSMTSSYHNLPEVNGLAQLPGREHRSQGMTADDDGCRTDIAAAYPTDAGITSWVRETRLARNADVIMITDTWTLDAPPSSLVWHLITHEAVEQTDDTIVVGDPGRSSLTIGFDQAVSVAIEVIELDDPKLTDAWGPRLCRLVITADDRLLTPQGSLTTTFRPVQPKVS